MGVGEIIFIALIAFFIAKLEIQIEGKDGWAKNLPTWKIDNVITGKLMGKGYPITGYHFWAFFTLITFIHLPFFVGMQWNLQKELELLSILLLITVLEDFLWLILNPDFGIKKFNSKFVGWHRWIGPIPLPYIILLLGVILLQAISIYFL